MSKHLPAPPLEIPYHGGFRLPIITGTEYQANKVNLPDHRGVCQTHAGNLAHMDDIDEAFFRDSQPAWF